MHAFKLDFSLKRAVLSIRTYRLLQFRLQCSTVSICTHTLLFTHNTTVVFGLEIKSVVDFSSYFWLFSTRYGIFVYICGNCTPFSLKRAVLSIRTYRLLQFRLQCSTVSICTHTLLFTHNTTVVFGLEIKSVVDFSFYFWLFSTRYGIFVYICGNCTPSLMR